MNHPVTRRELCAALGFLAVILREKSPNPGGYTASADARMIADLLEGFCTLDAGGDHAEADPDDHLEFGETAIINRFAVPHRMAAAIAAHTGKHHRCAPGDLLAAGFTQAEIDRHWVMAYALAQVQLSWGDA